MAHLYVIAGPRGASRRTPVDLAIKRVGDRVRQGGHSIPEEVIRRRFSRGVEQFWNHYKVLPEDWVIFDNSDDEPQEVALEVQGKLKIMNAVLFEQFQKGVSKP